MSLTIYLSQQAQITEAAAGRPAQRRRDFDVPPELVSRVIALGGVVDATGEVALDAVGIPTDEWRGAGFVRDGSYFGGKETLLDKAPADCAEAVAALEAILAPVTAARKERKDREAAEKAAERERERVAQERDDAALAAMSDEQIAQLYHASNPSNREARYLPTLRDVAKLPSASDDTLAARLPGINAVVARLHNAYVAAIEARDAADQAAFKQWVAEHGSARLKRCLDEEIECSAIFRDEYLAHEFPGWVRYEDVPWESVEARNPRDCAFELLDRAREKAPDAELWFWKDRDEGRAGYSAEVEIAIPGSDKLTRIVLTDDACTWDLDD